MKCDKCNHNLPEDSVFCQYCGNKVQAEGLDSKNVVDEVEFVLDETNDSIMSISDNTICEEAFNNSIEVKTNVTEKGKEVDNQSQPGHESEEGYEFVPGKPIYTNSLPSVDGENSVEKPPKKRNKKIKIRYCSRCGSLIDNESKICTGCKKKYFKIRLKKASIALLILSIILIASIVLNFFQYYEAMYLLERQTLLETQVSDLNVEIKKNLIDCQTLEFYQEYAVVVDENSNRYHKYGCEDFDDTSFWIYNVNAAKQKGYYACYKCK